MTTQQNPVQSTSFSFTTDGTTGPDWITRLEGKGHTLDHGVMAILQSPLFVPTSGVTTEGSVLHGFDEVRPSYGDAEVWAEAQSRDLHHMTLEAALYIRDKFTNEQLKGMGLARIIVLHEPVHDKDLPDDPGGPPPRDLSFLLCIQALRRAYSSLDLVQTRFPDETWGCQGVSGFALASAV